MQKRKNAAAPVRIECLDSTAGSERTVMLDFYLRSPVLNMTLHNELVKQREIATKITELKKNCYLDNTNMIIKSKGEEKWLHMVLY